MICDKPAIIRDTIKWPICGMNKMKIDCCDGLRIKQHGYWRGDHVIRATATTISSAVPS
jgi:hypothetical protein